VQRHGVAQGAVAIEYVRREIAGRNLDHWGERHPTVRKRRAF
jgi:hypothetical protein